MIDIKTFPLLILFSLLFSIGVVADDTAQVAPNEIIAFLEGEWWNVDITVSEDGKVTLNEYRELMTVKDSRTITVTAFEIKDGVDVTKDIVIEVHGDSVVMAQEDFEAFGRKEGNRIILEGVHDTYRIEFRLYLMGDTYIYQKDVWEQGRIIQSQMSYLQRIKRPGN